MKNRFTLLGMLFVVFICGQSLAQTTPALLWGKISGPWAGQFDGSFGTIAVNPSNPNIILIGSSVFAGPGVFKSTDGGVSWTAKNTGIQLLGLPAQNLPAITKIVISPSNPNVVYFSAATSPGGAGFIYKSLDGGESWQKVNGPQNYLGLYQIQNSVLDLDVNPLNPSIVYAGVSAQGIMKSTDGGANWSVIYAASPAPNQVDNFNIVRVSPIDPNTIFFSGFHDIVIDTIPVPTEDGAIPNTDGLMPFSLQKSTDGGSTWNPIGTLPQAALFTDLQFEPSSGNWYVSTITYMTTLWFPEQNFGIYKSSNSGQNWQSINQASFASLDQLPFVALLANPSSVNGGVFASGGLSTMLVGTINAGANWMNLDPCLLNAYIGRAALSANKLFILTSVGIYDADVTSLFPSISPSPSISTVSPSAFTGLPIGQRTPVRIIGSGFTSGSTLVFNDGTQNYNSNPTYLTFISANEIDYNISTGTNQANWTVQVVNGAQTSSLGHFTVNAPSVSPTLTGSLVVNLSPAGAISAGAQWQVDGTGYNGSGQVVGYLTTGSHTVSFKPISGYTTPANQIVTINANAQTTASGTYSAIAASTYTLTLNYNNTQGGASASPSAIGNIYNAGAFVQLYASASSGYHFTGWSGNASGTNNPTTIVMNGNESVTASFALGDPNMGTVIVTIQPPEAAAAGVTWGFNAIDSNFHASGTSYTTFPQTYLVYLWGTNNWTGGFVGYATITAGQTTNYTFVSSYTGGQIVGNDPRTYFTLAGSAGNFGSADGISNAAQFGQTYCPVVDTAGNVFVVDNTFSTIRKITPQSSVSTFAGQAGVQGSADGMGTNASFSNPWGLAIDSSNNLYVADTGNDTIRKITPSGAVSTLAGQAGNYGSANGTGSGALFGAPRGLVVDTNGNVYVADTSNETIRKITPAGVVTTLAGLVNSFGTADGTGNGARFNFPEGLAVDASGNVYVADSGNSSIRKVTPAGVVTTFAGFTGSGGAADGTGNTARFNTPTGIAIDTDGNIYVADNGNNAIRKVTQAGAVTTLAGLSGNPGSADGIGSAVRFHFPSGVAVDASGNLFITDSQNNTIRATQPLTTPVNQFITFAPLPNHSASDAPFTLTATSSSGLPVYLNVLSGPASLGTNNVLTILGGGTVNLVAWQPGNSNYNAATPVLQSFNVSQIPQTITFGSLSQQKVGDAPFSLYATSDSGLPVGYSVSGPAVLNGNILALTGWGTIVVTASQSGNASYLAATNVVQSFFVTPPNNTIVTPQRLPDGNFQMGLYGLTSSNYTIKFSTNLINWQTFTNFTGSNMLFYFNDPAATNFKQKFYRVMP